MLSLLSDILNTGSVHVISRCHGGNLDSTVGDALGSDELLVELAGSLGLGERFDGKLLFSQTSIDVEVLCLHDMVLLSLEKMLLLLVIEVHLLLHVERG